MIRTSTVLSALLLLAAAAPRADELRFAPKDGTKATRTMTQTTELASESFTLEIDGNEITPPGGAFPELSIVEESETVFTDEYVKCADGRAAVLVRSFDTIKGKLEQSMKMGDEEKSEDPQEKTSALQGKKVKFTWDKEKEEHAAAFEGEEKPDEALLDGLTAEVDAFQLLPTKPVEEGDTWEVDAKLADCVLSPGGDLHTVTGEKEEDPDDTTDDQLRDNMSGKVTVVYKGVQEVEGAKLAVLELTIEVATKAERPAKEGATQELQIGYELKGELRWNPAANMLVGYELEGPIEFTMTTNAEIDAGGESHTMKQSVAFKGATKIGMKTD